MSRQVHSPSQAIPGRLLAALGLVLLATAVGAREQPAAPVDFTRQVRPILSGHCFKCHGPDEKVRKGKLRLDLREEATRPTGAGSVPIVPGRPAASELVTRILSKDDEEIMPPPAAKLPLTTAEKETLRRWIAEGAEYQPHWSFVPPRLPALPQVGPKGWQRNPIDRFVFARMDAAGLKPSPAADRRVLARRVYLDLIGLPPTPEEIAAFVTDRSADAYERLVDRLLASPHYGERWARRWLDLARYADTNGYEKDRPRSIWPWRDWVIDALNRDLPFDEFTVEQLAGDLLPGATREQRIATGFHRNTMQNEEGGIDPLEYRFHAMADRVAVTGTTWLGLTVGCAQCHSHKFDPLTQRDYYRFMAFLDNADEPELELEQPGITARRREAEDKIEALLRELPNQWPLEPVQPSLGEPGRDGQSLEARRAVAFEEARTAWLSRETDRTVHWEVWRPLEARSDPPLLTVQEDASVFVTGDMTKRDLYVLRFRGDLRGVRAFRLEVLADPRLPRHGPGRTFYEGPKGDFFLSEFSARVDGVAVKLGGAAESYARVEGETRYAAALALDGDAQSGWSTTPRQGEDHYAVFNLAEPLAGGNELEVRLLFERYYAAGLGRFRIAVSRDERPATARDVPPTLDADFLTPAPQRTEAQWARLRRQFLLSASELAPARKAIDELRAGMPSQPTTLVLEERPPRNPRATFVHQRGEFLQPTERVDPGLPGFLPGLPTGATPDRLGFARWLVSPGNPLTARVTVNRQWAAFFGRGIVRTSEDFGTQGELPTHPELLDWLALEFVRQGWSLKQLHRLIVTSATYRQTSATTPDRLAKDPENRWLSRGPRFRLEGELVRDTALRTAGLLSPKQGGPSVFPPQPPGVSTEGAYGPLEWKVSDGEDRYRRGLYTFMKRTAPYAMFATFDAPSGESCLARRDVSNTPLQALTMLNDTVLQEAAQALGKTLAAQDGSDEDRIADLVTRVLARPPARLERKLMRQFVESQRARFRSGEGDPQALAGGGEPEAAVERAVWTALARVLINSDEFITRS